MLADIVDGEREKAFGAEVSLSSTVQNSRPDTGVRTVSADAWTLQMDAIRVARLPMVVENGTVWLCLVGMEQSTFSRRMPLDRNIGKTRPLLLSTTTMASILTPVPGSQFVCPVGAPLYWILYERVTVWDVVGPDVCGAPHMRHTCAHRCRSGSFGAKH